jgi:hypothetical protein
MQFFELNGVVWRCISREMCMRRVQRTQMSSKHEGIQNQQSHYLLHRMRHIR